MFKFEGFVDDNGAVPLMKAVAGIRVMEFKIVPVINAQVKNGKLVAQTSGDLLEMLAAFIKEKKAKEVDANFMKEFQVAKGRSVDAYSYTLRQAVEAKMLKRKPGGNRANQNAIYTVL